MIGHQHAQPVNANADPCGRGHAIFQRAEKIVVDISNLDSIGSAIHVRDIELSSEIEVFSDPDEIVVIITLPVSEEEFEVAEVVSEEPEVIERGKKEEEEGELKEI